MNSREKRFSAFPIVNKVESKQKNNSKGRQSLVSTNDKLSPLSSKGQNNHMRKNRNSMVNINQRGSLSSNLPTRYVPEDFKKKPIQNENNERAINTFNFNIENQFKCKTPTSSSYKSKRKSINLSDIYILGKQIPSLESLDRKVAALDRAKRILIEEFDNRISNNELFKKAQQVKHSFEIQQNVFNFCSPNQLFQPCDNSNFISPLISDSNEKSDNLSKTDLIGIRAVQRIKNEIENQISIELFENHEFWNEIASKVAENEEINSINEFIRPILLSESLSKSEIRKIMKKIKKILLDYIVTPRKSVKRLYADFIKIHKESSNYKRKLRNFSKVSEN